MEHTDGLAAAFLAAAEGTEQVGGKIVQSW